MNEAGTGRKLAYLLDCRLDTAAPGSEETSPHCHFVYCKSHMDGLPCDWTEASTAISQRLISWAMARSSFFPLR
jgi:hypothetical protein